MKKINSIKIGFCQFNPKFGNKEKNIETVKKLLKKKEANLFVLPELFNTGYTFCSQKEVNKLSEEIPNGFTTSSLIKLSQEKNCYFVAGLVEKNKSCLFNSAILVGPKGYIGTYRKAHLFYEEKKWFSSGNTPLKVYDLKFAKIGIMICFDWFFPEVARTLALKGAQIICHPANLVLPFCQKAMITRSIENHIFTITAK
ncbi:MAG: nitrilase-related carbon-nitrogen hydrolase [bacterium]